MRSLIAYNGADSGLGNRMRVVLGAKVLAEHERRKLLYVWPTGKLFGPRLTDLWDFAGGTRISRSVSRALAKLYPYETADLAAAPAAVRARRVRQIRTGGELRLPAGLRSWREEFRDLTPAADIAERVRVFYDEQLRGRSYVGVQIRAHAVSHPQTKEASPVSWFVERMRQIAARQPDTAFFVSCDVPDVVTALRAEIPHVHALGDKGEYNTVAGVKSAIVDLYLLASSGYVLGPHYSSFLHLADYLAGEQIPIETSQHTPPDIVDLDARGWVADPLRPAQRSAWRGGGAFSLAAAAPDPLPRRRGHTTRRP
ncbi:hypothetical protein [Microbacterium sp. TNHR37B]|uniref:hypothetical protein n=1 Tax=Microbacterium sp. TNHR37B TaxID=1775956 RepID=UPI00082E9F83|nr:hypothetical protein [Microbacterium sp. TNHR37B]